MGKVKTRFLGIEEIEKKQKQEQRKKAQDRDVKKKVKAPGKHKGGQRTVVIEAKEEAIKKIEKAQELIGERPEEKDEKKKKTTKPRDRGKQYLMAKRQVQKDKKYPLTEAIKLLKKIRYAKFDESVELHLNLLKEGLKGEAKLPHDTGKPVKVRVVDERLLTDVGRGKLDFDVLITHPSYMPRLAPLAKILGPKGLMPNPKTGTISETPEKLVKKFQSGVLRWKSEAKASLLHQIVGKVSFDEKKLEENIKVLLSSIGKGNVKNVYLTTTMGPSVEIDLTSV